MARDCRLVGGDSESIGVAEARSALMWWLEAGVDGAVQEQPRDWLRPAAKTALLAQTEPEPPLQPETATLSEFRDWLATAPRLPMAGAAAKRVLPVGGENAPIMIMTEAPEDPSGPVTGTPWELAQRMLAAIGIRAEDAYCASFSCFHSPGAKMSAADREACADIARRHIRHARPQQLLLFGDGPALALLGKRVAEASGHVHKVEGVRAVATSPFKLLLNSPSTKSSAWKDLLLLMEDDT